MTNMLELRLQEVTKTVGTSKDYLVHFVEVP